ncbi:hypothetical protein M409DRAFT_55681 [Zasmidium cellare ATCC 36951]|uniref:Asteroid domain-containing protein n=1 Tax=Zasmidium cellare ATCC 36951 TaxID=1080233 RepID=A0A6A6CFI2_ZASCE|nr:uncharacterized protein M409DRAFT_55681 [Zasmidium cellare ATCC 36951]KAF2165821.1 hypothetical protein M409DRAFT_55681 [Zasmidium cellare ATCC 36951]
MGIKRFGVRMRDYAIRDTLGSTESPAQDSIAIIDGPGLAHHVFYHLCDQRNAHISYKACVDAAITWLTELQSIGYKIQAMLFDGALPASKKDVRIGRLQSYTDRLWAYKQTIGSTTPTFSGQTWKNLSPPPFLVFAIVEELRFHEDFGNVTFMVPGEADPYCVAAAQAQGDDFNTTIFSDDADLLVYRLGQSTAVVAFRDLSISRTDSAITWTAEKYLPSEITKRSPNPIDDLIKPAYFMEKDANLPFVQACRKLKSTDPCTEADFASFESVFQTTEEVAAWAEIKKTSTEDRLSTARDSRVSEIIHQLESSSDEQASGGLRMYLPFILDDPSKKTSWNIGVGLRSLAYSLLLRHTDTTLGVQEYRRSGVRIASTPVEPLSEDETVDQAKQLTSHIEQVVAWAEESHGLSQADAWRCLVFQQVLSDLQADGYTLPSPEDSISIITRDEQPKWHLIHLAGQHEAAFYSFRMIKQVVAYVQLQTEEVSDLKGLAQHMESLPSISTFLGDGELDKDVWQAIVREVLSTMGEKDELEEERPRKKAKRAKKSGKSQPAGLEKNPFAMLSDG